MDMALLVGWLNSVLIAAALALHVRQFGRKQSATTLYLVGLLLLSVIYKTVSFSHDFYYVFYYVAVLLPLNAVYWIIRERKIEFGNINVEYVWLIILATTALILFTIYKPVDISGTLNTFQLVEIAGFFALIFIYKKIICPIITGFIFYSIGSSLSGIVKWSSPHLDWQVMRWVDPLIFTATFLIIAGAYAKQWKAESNGAKTDMVV